MKEGLLAKYEICPIIGTVSKINTGSADHVARDVELKL